MTNDDAEIIDLDELDENEFSHLQGKENLPFSFLGSNKDFYFIYLRTFLLTIITLGIYGPWAKVERERYLLGHTMLDGHGFDYLASPKTILIGRLIAVGVFVAYNVMAYFFIYAAFVFVPALILLSPWLIMKAINFRARNTSYRHVRFNFNGGYGQGFMVYVLFPFIPLAIMTFVVVMNEAYSEALPLWFVISSVGLALLFAISFLPYMITRQKNYVFNQLDFGLSSFSLNLNYRDVIKIVVIGVFIFLICLLIGGSLIYFILNEEILTIWSYGFNENVIPNQNLMMQYLIYIIGAIYIILFVTIFLIIPPVYRVLMRNLIMRKIALAGGHRFHSSMTIGGYVWIAFSNLFLSIITLFLYYPIAVIREHRYVVNNSMMFAAMSLDHFLEHEANAGGAAAAEFGAMDGVADGIGSGLI